MKTATLYFYTKRELSRSEEINLLDTIKKIGGVIRVNKLFPSNYTTPELARAYFAQIEKGSDVSEILASLKKLELTQEPIDPPVKTASSNR